MSWIQERTMRIIGNVYITVSQDEFTDAFIEWLESKGWSFFGQTAQLGDEDDDSESLGGVLPGGGSDDAKAD
ncbi:MAG: hypothetical protein OWU33_02840 [Firmicutes bacterium]|nr:hypothetical protein [Bacillota bacterium]